MMVRLTGNIVAEIYPDFIASVADVAHWYSPAYAAASVEAPEGVTCGMAYDPATGAFSAVPEPGREATTEDLLLELTADHEYRLRLVELGITEV